MALRNLGLIGQPLAGNLEPERRLLEANVLMSLGRYGEAAQRLAGWSDTSGWSNYARFNLGVALVRAGDTARGRQYLEQVGTMPASNEEQASLRDRANLALGFALLQQQGSDEPAAVLSRVRLDGPFTNKALLALGWAEANANHPERALVPWLELQQRTILDASVQESLIAVPYAYVKLASNGQASQQYRAAVDAYARESRRIDESIASIRQGGFLDSILTAVPKGDRPGWFWQLETLPDAPHTRYLYHLMASHEFQEGLKNYRDLRLMQANLSRWTDSLEAFGAMIEAREIAATQREPRRQEVLSGTDLAALAQRQQQLTDRFAQVEASREIVALASPPERAQWEALARIDATLASMPAGPQRDEFNERARLLRGALSWELDRAYKVRATQTRRDLKQTQAALAEAGTRLAAIGEAGDLVPRNTEGFASRVDALSERVARIVPLLDATALAQERALAGHRRRRAAGTTEAPGQLLDAGAVRAGLAVRRCLERWRQMSASRFLWLAIAGVVASGWSGTAESARKKAEPTLGSLAGRSAPVDRSLPVQAAPDDAANSYAGVPADRRRGPGAQGAGPAPARRPATRAGSGPQRRRRGRRIPRPRRRRAEAVAAYQELLRDYPEYAARDAVAVPARACFRSCGRCRCRDGGAR